MQNDLVTTRQSALTGVIAGGDVCAVCSRDVREGFIALFDLPEDLAELIRANAPEPSVVSKVCGRCIQLFDRAKNQIIKSAAVRKDGSHVLSIPLRLDADERFTGRGVTIAFLDSGFYPHDDLTQTRNRILAYHNLTAPPGDVSTLFQTDAASWHGMMTSVVAAGDGFLSDGFYRGIAPEADVVLVKLAKTGRITDENIRLGLEWILENHARFNIRVVNISAGGDREQSYLHDRLSATVEDCVRQGLTVVCAAGNAGHLPNHPVLPPASAPCVITVGGLDDNDSINRARYGMYRSSYGPTIDGLQKPEIIAPSIWVPAPILPNTTTANQAELLELLDKSPDEELHQIIEQHADVDEELDAALDRPAYTLRQIIALKLRQESVINKNYKFVDGTSFAAPIISSVIAQMLEAKPHLTPQQIKRILVNTAERLPHIEVDRQGWGVVNPRRAVEVALDTIS